MGNVLGAVEEAVFFSGPGLANLTTLTTDSSPVFNSAVEGCFTACGAFFGSDSSSNYCNYQFSEPTGQVSGKGLTVIAGARSLSTALNRKQRLPLSLPSLFFRSGMRLGRVLVRGRLLLPGPSCDAFDRRSASQFPVLAAENDPRALQAGGTSSSPPDLHHRGTPLCLRLLFELAVQRSSVQSCARLPPRASRVSPRCAPTCSRIPAAPFRCFSGAAPVLLPTP